MSTTTTPGQLAEHRFITDDCRAGKTDDGALAEALASMEAKAREVLSRWPADRGMRLHFVLCVERPSHPGAQP